ncbi:hypothetical protein EDD86DRAFT_249825 [Gorgonomyces haynaldii]|nr:hypothetical protein EDD86DRAFT_249825 [Gorgonomyces haynaldii]
MSWKGFKKAINRLPATIGKATGNISETKDEEYEQYSQQLENLYTLAKKLSEDAKKFKDSLSLMLSHQSQIADEFVQVFMSITHQSQEHLNQMNVAEAFASSMKSAKETLQQELEQIERLVVAPTQDYITLLEQVRKLMVKRSHKLLDYDRHRSSVDKLKNKQGRTAQEEKTLGQYENQLDQATREYNNVNNLLKQELPVFLGLRVDFIDPCLLTFYNYQVRVFHTLYGIFYQAASDHFDLSTTALASYEIRANQTSALLTSLNVPKRFNAKPEHVPEIKQDKPKSNYVVALYDFDAQTAGDLSFKKNDKIEVIERKDNVNDWWTGKFNGKTGNYVQEAS